MYRGETKLEFVNQKLKEFNDYIRYRKVAVIGLGVSNLPLLDYLYEKKAKVTVFDSRKIEEISKEVMDKITAYNYEFSLGENYLSKLVGFQVIFRSPSCLPNQVALIEEENRGALVTSEVELVMEMAPCKIIGVTGSDGKTTTTSLIYEIMKQAGYHCYLGGNIGIPLFTKLEDMVPEDIVILELSSFQLMNMNVSPNVAVITNISPNHLNVHHSYEEYIEAKKTIFRHQTKEDILVLNYDNELTKQAAKEAEGKVVFFSSKEKLENGVILDGTIIKECEDRLRKHIIGIDKVLLRGRHNYENICAAIAATKSFVDLDEIVKAITKFNGVEHRLEFIKEIEQVKWYNDSIATSPTRTIAGLQSFEEEIVLIAGGYDKHLDYTPIGKPILDHAKALILMGQTAHKIQEAVMQEAQKQGREIPIYLCDSLQQTVQVARQIATRGQIVLFSPASASFDNFKNFEERGEKFKEFVNGIME